MTPQKKAIAYKKLALEHVESLRKSIGFCFDCDVNVRVDGKWALFTSPDTDKNFVIDGLTWKDFYANIATAEDIVEMLVVLNALED